MSDAINSIPLEEDDCLRTVGLQREELGRIRPAALQIITGLDPLWPAIPGCKDCRECGLPLPKHKPHCIAKLLLGV